MSTRTNGKIRIAFRERAAHEMAIDGVTHVTWLHPLSAPSDHDPEPVSKLATGGEMVGICDFCSGPGPRWSYDCESFTLASYGSVGAWAACFACHACIERETYNELVARAVGGRGRMFSEEWLQMAALLGAFKRHRRGPAVKLW